jgi:two-component sensor histidine kinase
MVSLSRVRPSPNARAPRDGFARLAAAVRELSGARTHADIIEITRRAAREITGAMGVAIVLRDGDCCHYIAEDSEVPLWSGQRFPLTGCISGWAMLNRQVTVVSDVYADPRIRHAVYRPTGIHSLVMAPVGEPEPFAALGAYWRDVREPTADEISSVEALAGCLGAALQTIDLMGSLRAELDHTQILVNELNHRVKNTLAIIQSLAAQTLRGERPTPAARADFESRLLALAGAHALVTEAEWRSVSLRELVERTIRPFMEGEGPARFELAGAPVTLPPKSAVAFALAVHELCVNAAKFGALAADDGRVAMDWAVAEEAGEPRLRFAWREAGGPPVQPPAARGFGSRLLERGLASELQGEVRLSFPPEGLVCRMDVPAPRNEPEALFPLPR